MSPQEVRQIVLRDDISDLEKIEENFNERDPRIVAGEMRPRKVKNDENNNGMESSDSDGMSSFDSAASRINFWKDINTSDQMYEGAVIMAKNKTLAHSGDNLNLDKQLLAL